MARLRAILIGVPTPDATTPAFAAADAIVERMDRFLKSRFEDAQIVRLGAATRKQDVLDAFATMATALADNTRFVVLFAGHGIAAQEGHELEAWALNGDEFTEDDLAAALVPFRTTDNIVISDCCFGGGMFAGGHHEFPLTSIAAAGADGFVIASIADQLIEEIIAAATGRWTYARLAEQFRTTAFTGRAFEIVTRPPGNMELEILAP
ncbi:MAG: Caspase domain [Deltaproteobacteria bacterium]|nr:Caspase domain [Deltaproteobacteria bacterium]